MTEDAAIREKFMKAAFAEAEKAYRINEVPVGAVIVKDGKIIARAHNIKERKGCALWHAEIRAIQRASRKIGDWRLNGCDIYVTLEPCPMCSGALIHARIDNIYFGAYDGKGGCCGSLYNLCEDKRFNHRPNVVGGVMAEECGAILTRYFREKRGRTTPK